MSDGQTINQAQGMNELCRLTFGEKEVDIIALKCVVAGCIGRIKDFCGGKPNTREISLAVTKLQEAVFWLGENNARN